MTKKDKKTGNGISEDHQFIKKELFDEIEDVNVKPTAATQGKKIKLKKKTKKRQKEGIDEKLMEIYENADGTMPDMTHFEKQKNGSLARSLIVLFFACVFLAAVTWMGFFMRAAGGDFSEEDLVLSISGEEKVAPGQELRYRVRYRNSQSVNLTDVLLQVRYPEGFVLTDTSRAPTNENKDEWTIGNLGEKDSGYIDIYGKMYGGTGGSQSFRVFLNYRAENFSSEFQKVTVLNLGLVAPPIKLTVEGKEGVVSGAEVELNIFLEKEKDINIANLALELVENPHFSLRDSNPEPDQFIENRWNLMGSDGEKITVKGVFDTATAAEEELLKFNLVGWKDENRDKAGYVYFSQDYSVKLLQTDLIANLVINGASSNINVSPGEVLNGTVVLRNAGAAPLKNAVARVIFDAPSHEKISILGWAEIENPQDADIVGEQLSAGTRRGILSWSRNQILDLRQIDPEEEIVADFSLPIKDSEDTDLLNFTDFKISATLEVRYDIAGEEKIISSAPMVFTLNSDTALEIKDLVEYVGDKEKHNLTWLISNTFHELSNIRLEANIYGDIEWHEDELSVPAGELNFDEQNKKLVWTVEKMPLELDIMALQFAFTLKSKNPTQTNLTSKVIFNATDTVTGEPILIPGREILLN